MYVWAQPKEAGFSSLAKPIYAWVQSKNVGSSSLANLVCLGSTLSLAMYTWAQGLFGPSPDP